MNVAIVNLPDACSRASWRQRIVTAAALGTPVNLTTVTLTALRQADGVALATVGSAHGFIVGDTLTLAGAGEAGFNGTVEVTSVPSTTTFTYRVAKDTPAVATGTVTARGELYYRRAWFLGNKAARTANTGIVYLGLEATNDTQPMAIAAGAERTLEAATGARLSLADLWLDVATNADGVVILWH